MVQPDPEQQDLLDRGLAHLRRAGAGQPALIGTALGLRDCIGQDGSWAAIRAALPLYGAFDVKRFSIQLFHIAYP